MMEATKTGEVTRVDTALKHTLSVIYVSVWKQEKRSSRCLLKIWLVQEEEIIKFSSMSHGEHHNLLKLEA